MGIPKPALGPAVTSLARARELCEARADCQMLRADPDGNITLLGGGAPGNMSINGKTKYQKNKKQQQHTSTSALVGPWQLQPALPGPSLFGRSA